MAEFKVDPTLTDEISALRTEGEKINDSYKKISSEDVKTLKTSLSILSQHGDLKRLLDNYQLLILRDALDLDNLVAEAKEMDATISASQKA